MDSNKQLKLDKLNAMMSVCSLCVLRSGCKQVVPGDGSADAEIMFIGEAPGKKEDEIGRPFIGAAGKFLSEMLATIKLKREDIYIANVAKCRPPENRDPKPEEVEACWPWLLEQIRIIDPKIIVTLGRHSMARFFPELKISEAHGKLMQGEVPGIGKKNFYILYHPAAALYNGSLRKTLADDFRQIPAIIKKIDNGFV
jgi:DNA polymerase